MAKSFCLDYNKAIAQCPKDKKVVAMPGYCKNEDFYIFVKSVGIETRTANKGRYGHFKELLFIDGAFVCATRIDKLEKIRSLYAAGHIEQAKLYAQGHMLYKETALGGSKINKFKEAARLSHTMCDTSGKVGHDIRQMIRKQILEKSF